jgi:hypothetical protein
MARATKAELEELKIVRCFQRYSHEQRSNNAASHRQGYLQKRRSGEFFYVSELIPGIGFPTQGRAVEAARKVLASQQIETAATEAA